MKRVSARQVQSSERFYRVPKIFVESPLYKPMSADAKFTYAILKDRFELSLRNNWIDKNGDVYLIYTVDELQEILGYGNKKVIKLKKELQEYGLLEEVRQGLNQPNLLYLGNVEYYYDLNENNTENSPEPLSEAEVSKRHFQKNSGSVKTTLQEMSKRHANDTEYSDTENKEYSSRKTGADSSTQAQSDSKYIAPKYYSLLQVIANKYNDRYMYPEGYTLTHPQKMKIGQYLADGFVTSQEVLDMIDNIPNDCESPLAYLFQMLENLKSERLVEMKMLAHRVAEKKYGAN